MPNTNFKGITIQLDINSDQFDKNLKRANRAVDDFDRQLKKLDDALKLNPKNMDAVDAKFDLLQQKTIQLSNNVKEFEEALNDLKTSGVERTDKRFIDVVASLQKARSELAKYNDEMARLERVSDSSVPLFFGSSSFGARFEKLSGSLSNYEKKIKDINDAIKASGSAYDLHNTKLKLNEEYQESLTHYVEELESVMRQMREKGLKPTSDEYVKYTSELGKARGKLIELKEAEENLWSTERQAAERERIDNLNKQLSIIDAIRKKKKQEYEEVRNNAEKERTQNLERQLKLIDAARIKEKERNRERKKHLADIFVVNRSLRASAFGIDESLFEDRLDNIGKSVSGIGSKFISLGKTLGDIASRFQTVSRVAQAALVGSGGLASAAIAFEDAFASVKKTVDETKYISYDDLKDSIIEMSKVLPSSANDIAEIVALAGQLGVETENVTQFSRAMIDLGNSTNLSSEDAAQMVAQFFNITKGDLSKVENFSSALVELGNNSATTEADIMELAFRLAGAGGNLKFTQQQILALATALSSAGLKAEAAGGSMSTVLQNIQKEVSGTDWNEANKGLKVWGELIGTTGKEFKRQWSEDAFGTFQKVIQGLGTFRDEGGDVTSKLAEMGIETIRTTDSMSRLASAYKLLVGGDGKEGFVDMANRAFLAGNALQIESAKRYETTKSQLQILVNNVKALGIEMGKQLLPIINKYISKGIKLIDKNKDWISSNTVLIAKMTALAAAIHPALKLLQGLATSLGSILRGAGGVIRFISKMSSFSLAFGALGLATAGAVTYFSKFTEESTKLGEKLSDTRQRLEEYYATSQENLAVIRDSTAEKLGEIDYYKNLSDELFTLIDRNGKVKEGYEDRYNFIMTKLAEAGVIEREDIDKSIKKQDEYRESINKSIEAMQGESIMEGATQQYTQALQDRKQAVDWLRESWEDVQHAKEVLADYEANDFSKYTLQEYENAQKLLETNKMLEEQYNKSNAIISNYEAMKRAYESGDTDALLTLYYQSEYSMIDAKENEIYEMLSTKFSEILKMREEMDTDDPMWADMLHSTEREFEEMAKAVGFNIDQALAFINAHQQELLDSAAAIKNAFGGVGSVVGNANRFRIPNTGFYQSGGFGFNSGGLVSNVTINVNNNGKTITANEVRRWASIINEQLGGSF